MSRRSDSEFEWLVPNIPAAVRERYAPARATMYAREVRQQASLLKGLGYDRTHALLRCQGNRAWGDEAGVTAPLTTEDIIAIVDDVYGQTAEPPRKTGRGKKA